MTSTPQQELNQANDDPNVTMAVTAIVREADEVFQRVGGSSRHWVRECFLPILNLKGWMVQRSVPAPALGAVKSDGESEPPQIDPVFLVDGVTESTLRAAVAAKLVNLNRSELLALLGNSKLAGATPEAALRGRVLALPCVMSEHGGDRALVFRDDVLRLLDATETTP